MKLISNKTLKNHHEYLSGQFKVADTVWIAVAYLKSTGLDLLRPHLIDALKRGAKIEMFCGLDFCLTDAKSLLDVYELFEGADAKLYLCEIPKVNFHPKLYCFGSNDHLTAVIGSANLSKGALQTNVELSTIETVPADSEVACDILRYFHDLKDMDGVDLAEVPELLTYQHRAQVHQKYMKKAEQEVRKELIKMKPINAKKLKHWLDQYRQDMDLQQDFQIRAQKYKKARRILNELAADKPLSRKQFAARYGQLVGRDGVKLWSSGSIYRSRNAVEGQSRQAMKMFRAVRKRIGSSPQQVFDEGLRFAENVTGVGPNVLTEAMHTWAPERYAAMNKNPLESLNELGFPEFPHPQSFTGATYADFNRVIMQLAKWCKFESLGQMDQFLNYIYWKLDTHKKRKHKNG